MVARNFGSREGGAARTREAQEGNAEERESGGGNAENEDNSASEEASRAEAEKDANTEATEREAEVEEAYTELEQEFFDAYREPEEQPDLVESRTPKGRFDNFTSDPIKAINKKIWGEKMFREAAAWSVNIVDKGMSKIEEIFEWAQNKNFFQSFSWLPFAKAEKVDKSEAIKTYKDKDKEKGSK